MHLSRPTLALVLVALVGGGIGWRLRPKPPEPAASPEGAPATALSPDLPQPVSGVAAVRDTLWISVSAAGRAEATHRATLQARVGGLVESVPVRENAAVEAGQPLAQIDATEYALAVARAISDLRRARADYQQMVQFDDRIEDPEARAVRDALARSRSGLDQSEVAWRAARLQLERTRVQAPFAGRIADLRVAPGQLVSAGAELMTVVALDPMEVEVDVLEAEIGLLAEGRRATVRFAAFPGETFEGRIAIVNPVIDPDKRTGRVTVALSNPGGRIKPGMYAEASLAARSLADRVLVPRAAILERGEGRRRTMVFVYAEGPGGGRAKWRYVTTGRENDSLVEIVPSEQGALSPGEIVLVDGHHYLAHDSPVRLVESVEAARGRPER